MEELPKIELNPVKEESVKKKEVNYVKQDMNGQSSKRKIIIPVIVVGFIIFFVLAIILPGIRLYKSASKTYSQGRIAWDAVKKQDIALASSELEKTREELKNTQKSLYGLSLLRFIPILSWYYNDADHMIKAGFYGLDSAKVVIESIEPYSDILGLKGQGSFVMGTAEQRVETAVMTMGKITPHIDEVSQSFSLAKKEIDEVNPSHYPAFLGGGKIQKQLQTLKNLVDEGAVFVNEARPLIKILPSLLGEKGEKKYLILFQNDKELRPTGGFITAYAIFRIDKGIIHVETSDDIYALDNKLRTKQKAPTPVLKYLPSVTTLNIRDSNLSPDFVKSMETFNSLYEETSGKTEIDGIIALDTSVLVEVIKILDGEIVAGGIKFTAENDKRCDCPQVIYRLEELISTPKSVDLQVTTLAAVQAQRKDILGTLLYALMEKALKSSPKLYWGPLIQEMFRQTDQKHVLFYLFDKSAQSGVEALNAAGRIKSFEGDYLHINQANLGGAKANIFVKEEVLQNIEVAGDGTLTKTITIDYKNPHPPSDCNLERGNLCINATLRDWIRVYVPKGSELIDAKGSEVKVTSYEELGKTVFDGFVTVRPLGKATYSLTYKLPFKLAKNSPLLILIQKQPGTYANQYTIKSKGKEIDKFTLTTDKKLKINLQK